MITIDILPGTQGNPPTVRASTASGPHPQQCSEAIMANTDDAMVARAMLQAAAYLFAQGQPVQFGAEVPREALK